MIKVGDHVHIKPDWQIRECLYNKNATVVFMDYEDERATIQFTDEALKDEALAGFAKVSAPLIHPDCIRISVGRLAPGWGYEGFKHNFIIVDEMSYHAVAANMYRNSIYGKDAIMNNLINQIKNISFTNRKKDGACVTTIIWKDETRTMATCSNLDERPDFEIGICICIAKKAVGDTLELKGVRRNGLKSIYRKFIPGYREMEKEEKERKRASFDADKYNEGMAFTDCPRRGYDIPFQNESPLSGAGETINEKFNRFVKRVAQYRKEQKDKEANDQNTKGYNRFCDESELTELDNIKKKDSEFRIGQLVKINEDYHYTIIAGKEGVVKEIKNISGDFEYLVSVNGFYINFWIGEEDLSPVYMEPNKNEGGTV